MKYQHKCPIILMGSLIAALAGTTMLLVIGLLNAYTFSDEYTKSSILANTGFLSVILLCALMFERYWMTILVVGTILFLYGVWAIAYLVPYNGHVSLLVHLWQCKGMLFTPIVNIIISAVILQRFCIHSGVEIQNKPLRRRKV